MIFEYTNQHYVPVPCFFFFMVKVNLLQIYNQLRDFGQSMAMIPQFKFLMVLSVLAVAAFVVVEHEKVFLVDVIVVVVFVCCSYCCCRGDLIETFVCIISLRDVCSFLLTGNVRLDRCNEINQQVKWNPRRGSESTNNKLSTTSGSRSRKASKGSGNGSPTTLFSRHTDDVVVRRNKVLFECH